MRPLPWHAFLQQLDVSRCQYYICKKRGRLVWVQVFARRLPNLFCRNKACNRRGKFQVENTA